MAVDQPTTSGMQSSEHRTVSRVMAILEAVIAREPQGLRLSDLSDIMQAPKSTIHGLAKGLVTTGYLREADGRYYQGSAIALLIPGARRVPTSFHRALSDLCGRWNESAVLATLVGDSVVNVDVVESHQLIRAHPEINVRRPLWPTSYGKNFLAHMDPRRRDAYLRRRHPDPRERKHILAELEQIRSERVAFNREENIPGLYGLSSPIIREGSEVSLAIGLVGPMTRMAGIERKLAADVRRTAVALTAEPDA